MVVFFFLVVREDHQPFGKPGYFQAKLSSQNEKLSPPIAGRRVVTMSKKNNQKFVIKPFRANVHMDSATADKIWAALQLAIGEIHNKNASTLSFEELYRQAYSLVLHKHGEKLYNGVFTTVTKHLSSIADQVSNAPDETLLVALSRRWDDHKVTMVMIRDILMYMDRTYVVQNKKTPVYDMGLEIFRDAIARHVRVKSRLIKNLLSNVDKERRGEQIDRLLMKNSLSMLVELGVHSRDVYEEDFEKVFLETTRDFYRNESLQYITKNTCPVRHSGLPPRTCFVCFTDLSPPYLSVASRVTAVTTTCTTTVTPNRTI